MENNIPHKIFPKGLKLILLILLSFFFLVLTVSKGIEIKDKLRIKGTITFSGQGKAIGVPDVALVSLSVITENMEAKKAMDESAKAMNEVIKFVKEYGIDEKDIKTSQYSLSPQYDWIEGKRVFRGYQLTSTLAVKIRNLEKIGEIIDGAVSKGVNQVGDIQLTIDDLEKLKEEARTKAIENTKEKAESVARNTGLKLGDIVNFTEEGPVSYSLPLLYEKTAGLGGGEVTPEIEKGTLEISLNVSLTFELR
jgi:hypothetical protein